MSILRKIISGAAPVLLLGALSLPFMMRANAEGQAVQVPLPALDETAPASGMETAIFAGGCFWCMEGPFDRIPGVVATISGYTGGKTANPTYEDVSSGRTGHAEAVAVVYDPRKVSYEKLLEVFWVNVDPTTKDRQGADKGPQYRSVIFTHSDAQKETAEKVKKALDESGAFKGPIVTEILPTKKFWTAEAYHQDYFKRNPEQGYCAAVIAPKMDKFKKAFEDALKKK